MPFALPATVYTSPAGIEMPYWEWFEPAISCTRLLSASAKKMSP